jgi:carboxyl-terminal processing protease
MEIARGKRSRCGDRGGDCKLGPSYNQHRNVGELIVWTLKDLIYGSGLLLALFGLSWLIFMPNNAERGAWRLQTGGAILHLTPFTATSYTESHHSCLSNISFPAHLKIIELAEGVSIRVVDGQLHFSSDGALQELRLDKLDTLPERCVDAVPSTSTAKDVFEAVWTAMDENYAFFDLYGVDWTARRDLVPDPETEMTDDGVMAMLLLLTEGIDDGHVYFGSEELGNASPSNDPAWLPEDGTLGRDTLNAIAISNAGVPLIKAATAPIHYGLRDDGVGYIQIRKMNVDVPFGGNSTDAMATAFGEVLAHLADAKSLVIDIRYNPGGSDTVSFGVAGHFIAAPTPVFTKTTRFGDTQTEPFTAVLQPIGDTPVSVPVVLLTSRLTGSAAEILTLAMREIDQVVVLGEPTGGGLSDVMEFTLPNGWGLGLSNQTYLNMSGELFESVGIPPDVAVEYHAQQYISGRDPVLKAAFAQAQALAD